MKIKIKFFENNFVEAIKAGIYEIYIKVNGKEKLIYIGESVFVLVRCATHLYEIAKGNGYFAHGKTLKEARESLMAKIFENMDSDEAISEFINKFEKNKAYPGTDFFEWHHYLTGSCLMGRESFVKNHGLDLNRHYTVKEFINICENDYGGEIIKKLKEFYE